MSLTLYGGQSINGFMGLNYSLNSTELSAIKSSDTNWTWGYNTFCLAKLNGDLNAGNISLSELLDSWKIYRKNITNEDTLYTAVGETSTADIQSIRDFMPANRNEYQFMIVGKTDNYLSDAIYSDVVKADYFYWSITSESSHDIWKFRLKTGNDIEGKYTVNSSVSIVTNFSKFPVVSFGKPLYRSNTLQALIGDIDSSGDYSGDTVKNMKSLIAFLNNGEIKILKSPKGDVLRVQTYTSDYSTDNDTLQMEQTINFSFVEIGNTDDVSLFDEITS